MKTQQPGMSRRTFLQSAAGAAAVFQIVPRHILGGTETPPPSERLNFAAIGAGGQAEHDIMCLARHANVAALCDVDDERASKTYEQYADVPKYKDFRVMLEKEKNIDAVLVATPDHFHAVAAMAAMQLGKHVYVEKPMAHSIAEVRKMREAAKQYKVVTQMGNQGHSFRGCHILKEWMEKKVIGPVDEVLCWTDRPIWPQGIERPTDTPPVPATLNWDLWLGPAQERPYNPAYAPRNWRGWYDFGTGALGDMGCHILDAPFFALNLGFPEKVEAESSGVMKETYPAWSIIRYYFPKRGKMPAVKLTWYDGGKMPDRPKELGADRRMGDENGGSIISGKKGKIMLGTYSNGIEILSGGRKPSKDNGPEGKMSSHHENFVLACMGKEEARSHFDYAAQLTEMVLLGNLALRTGKTIEWDSASMKVKNVPEAQALVECNYRQGWTL